MSNKQLKLKTDDKRLIKVSVREICQDGSWGRTINNREVQLSHCPDGFIRLCIDNNVIDKPTLSWRVVEQAIPVRQLNNGRRWPQDCRWHWFVVGHTDGKRYKYLYLNAGLQHIGTRTDYKLKYISTHRSKRQRAYAHKLKAIRLGFGGKRRRWEARRERARERYGR